MKQIDLSPDTGDTVMHLYSPQPGFITRNRTPASNETGARIDLVAGAVFRVDANSIPVIVSHWIYIPEIQGARKMKRIGILQ